MTSDRNEFNKRVVKIDHTHRQIARGGFAAHLADNGVIVVKPRRTMPAVPLQGLVLLLLGFFFFKAVLFAHLGGQTYLAKIESLSQGTMMERVSAAAMAPDRFSVTMARFMPFLK